MASPPLPPPLMYSAFRKILVLSVLLLLFVSVCHSLCSESQFQSRRRMLEAETHEDLPLKKKSSSTQTQNQNQKQSLKNQTKLIKPKISMKNQTKTTIQSQSNNLSSKNQTKKASQSSNYLSTKNQTKLVKVTDTGLKKMNSTSKIKKQLNSTSKPLNSTKTAPISSKKSVDLPPKASGSKNKTTTTTTTKSTATTTATTTTTTTTKETKTKPTDKNQKPKKPIKASWIDSDDDDDDFVSELKDLPSKFQQTLIPDLERISTTSKAYITKANKQITKGFKPYVGNKYAPTIATILSCAFALIPLILVSLIFNRIKAYFSLQKILIFVQIYLSIYFSILCLSSLVTGLEPLKFFYATSQATYVCLQVFQTLGYVFYLLLLLMHLILVFSTECGMGSRFLGLAQTMLGFAVGLHYYVTVFHRVVLRQPPKTNWKVHGIYATCFLLICVLAGADRRKKAYLEDGGEEGKKN